MFLFLTNQSCKLHPLINYLNSFWFFTPLFISFSTNYHRSHETLLGCKRPQVKLKQVRSSKRLLVSSCKFETNNNLKSAFSELTSQTNCHRWAFPVLMISESIVEAKLSRCRQYTALECNLTFWTTKNRKKKI